MRLRFAVLALVAGGCHSATWNRELPSAYPRTTGSPVGEDVAAWLRRFDGATIAPVERVNGAFSPTVLELRDGALAQIDGASVPATDPAFSFVHLSDVQLRDEQLRFHPGWVLKYPWLATIWQGALDFLVPSVCFDPDQEIHDIAVYLALLRSIEAADREAAARLAGPAERPLFLAHTGDASHVGAVSEFVEFGSVSSTTYIPFLHCVGNHDIGLWGTQLPGRQTVNSDEPCWHSYVRDTVWLQALRGEDAPYDLSMTRPVVETRRCPPIRFKEPPAPPYQAGDMAPWKTWVRARKMSAQLTVGGDGSAFGRGWESGRVALPDGRRFRLIVLNTAARLHLSAGPDVGAGSSASGGELSLTKGAGADDISLAEAELTFAEQALLAAAEAGESVLMFGHHPLSCSDEESTGVPRLIRAVQACPTFVAYFCGHTHEYALRPSSPTDPGFVQIVAPSILEYPQAGLWVTIRVTEAPDGPVVVDVDPIIGPWRAAGEGKLDAARSEADRGSGGATELLARATLGRSGAARDKCLPEDPERWLPRVRLLIR